MSGKDESISVNPKDDDKNEQVDITTSRQRKVRNNSNEVWEIFRMVNKPCSNRKTHDNIPQKSTQQMRQSDSIMIDLEDLDREKYIKKRNETGTTATTYTGTSTTSQTTDNSGDALKNKEETYKEVIDDHLLEKNIDNNNIDGDDSSEELFGLSTGSNEQEEPGNESDEVVKKHEKDNKPTVDDSINESGDNNNESGKDNDDEESDDEDEEIAEKIKKNNDHRAICRLENTIRGNYQRERKDTPSRESSRRRTIERAQKRYPYYLKRLYMECALDNPKLLEIGYTHYSESDGLLNSEKGEEENNWDTMIELIKTIETNNDQGGAQDDSNDAFPKLRRAELKRETDPHPKLREWHRRIEDDRKTRGATKYWKIKKIFHEAAMANDDILNTIQYECYYDDIGFCNIDGTKHTDA